MNQIELSSHSPALQRFWPLQYRLGFTAAHLMYEVVALFLAAEDCTLPDRHQTEELVKKVGHLTK